MTPTMTPRREKILFACGFLFSPVYSLIMRMRALCYQKKFFRRHRLAVPVISVGNISMGGTGKTPLVIALARHLLEKGFSPAVVSRGYAGSFRGEAGIVSDGVACLLSATVAGDEPCLLARSLVGVPVVIGRKRLAAAQLAISRFAPDVLLLDDGFQHLALERDLDIVLFRAEMPAGIGRVFPGGPLREPLSALQRADVFVVTGVAPGDTIEPPLIQRWLGENFPQRPIYAGRTQPLHLVRDDGGILPLSTLSGQKTFIFCAIAAPERFVSLVNHLGADICGSALYRDHHAYSDKDLLTLTQKARETGAAFLLTTAKDMVKVTVPAAAGIPVLALEVSSAMDPAFLAFAVDRLHAEQHGPSR